MPREHSQLTYICGINFLCTLDEVLLIYQLYVKSELETLINFFTLTNWMVTKKQDINIFSFIIDKLSLEKYFNARNLQKALP